MRIDKLHIISYGKLRDMQITFGNGLNIILGKNEAGKSTIMAFIKAMLYGFTGRGTGGDRKRYTPWDSGVMAGELTFTAKDGKQYVIQRKSGRTPAQDTCHIIDAVTGEAATISIEEEIGIGENGFLKTLFVRQISAGIHGGDDELTDKLINLAVSGDEDTGYHKAIDILKNAARLYKHQRGEGGKIYSLQRKVMELGEELAAAETENHAILSKMARVEMLRREIPKYREDLLRQDDGRKALEISHVFSNIKGAKMQVEAAENALTAAKERYQAVLDELQKFSAFDRPIQDIVYQETDTPEKIQRQHEAEKKNTIRLMLFAALFLLAGVVMQFVPVGLARIPLTALGIGGIALILFLAYKRKKKSNITEEMLKNAEEIQAKKAAELSHFGCRTLQEYTEAVAQKTALSEKKELVLQYVAECEARVRKEEENLAYHMKALEQYGDAEKLAAQNPQEAVRAAEEKKRILDNMVSEAANLEGILSESLKKTRLKDVICTEKYEAEEALREAEQTYEAILAAQNALDEAFSELCRDFTPKINALASEYLSVLTGKKEGMLLDKQYNITLDREGHRGVQFFSDGTIDQAYLAARLSMASLLFSESPIFLDDVFYQYDEERTQNAMHLLHTLGDKRQIILFSCHSIADAEKANIIRL